MSVSDPGGQWPPPYPVTPGSPPEEPWRPEGSRSSGRIWGVTFAWAGAVYVVLVAVHLATSSKGSVAYRAGEMLTIALVTGVVVALLAVFAGRSRPWSWWVIGLAVIGISAAWFVVIEVVPRVATDTPDYALTEPEKAGPWTQNHTAQSRANEKAARARLAKAPADFRAIVGEPLYADYLDEEKSVLTFIGFNIAEDARDDVGESPADTVREAMAGAGVDSGDVERQEAGELGGALSCTTTWDQLPSDAAYCVWADGSTVGQVALLRTGVTLEDAAETVLEFRGYVTER